MINLFERFRSTATTQPQRCAIVGPARDGEMTYGELLERIEGNARELAAFGVGPGSCVGVHVGSGVDYLCWTYAIWEVGACAVPIPIELKRREKRAIIDAISVELVLTDRRGKAVFKTALRDTPRELVQGSSLLPIERQRAHPDGFEEIDAAFIRFSSGTTGTAKGVVLSHQTIYERCSAANESLQIGPDDRVVFLQSMSYHFAVSVVSYLTFGATIILCPDHFGATIIDSTLRHRGTLIYGTPHHYELMASCSERKTLNHLRGAISTAMSLPDEVAVAFAERFDVEPSQAYGIIEIGLPAINLGGSGTGRGTVGPLGRSYELDLVDIGHGSTHKAISLRGPGMLDAYYEPFERREQITRNGWFSTGDLGFVDEEGLLHITGRSKGMLCVLGMKFFPQEVEEALIRHPAVAKARVFPQGDALLGATTCAEIVLTKKKDVTVPSAPDLRAHCSSLLAPFKIPNRFEIVDDIQRTASGKLLRR